MKTYLHSGTLGDLIYSLSIVNKLGTGKFLVALENVANVTRQYFGHDGLEEHRHRLTTQDYISLYPLLIHQPYITEVEAWDKAEIPIVNLDNFRAILFKTFMGNYVEAYHKAFGILTPGTVHRETWLTAEVKEVKPVVVCRSSRYRCPNGNTIHKDLYAEYNVRDNGVFIGSDDEYNDYVSVIGEIDRYNITDFLDMANVINGSDMFISNQTFAFSLAMGLGKNSILETRKDMPLLMNECYFPRPNVRYF
jgi:hypothetical protein